MRDDCDCNAEVRQIWPTSRDNDVCIGIDRSRHWLRRSLCGLAVLVFLTGCGSPGPIQVVDSDVSSLGAGYYDPVYIPTNGCLIQTIDRVQGTARVLC